MREYRLRALACQAGKHPIATLLPASYGLLAECADGVLFTPSALVVEWLPSLLLNLPFDVVILEPESLRERVREIGERATALAKGRRVT